MNIRILFVIPLFLVLSVIFLLRLMEFSSWQSVGSNPAAGIINETDAIATVRSLFPELRGYPSDDLPPRSVRTERSDEGWYVAFVQEGSGIPVLGARCFLVGNDGSTKEKKYAPTVGVSSDTFSVKDCAMTGTRGDVVGGDRDEHGCLGPAGYSWCESKRKCLRVWEEPCDGSGTDTSACVVQNCHGMDISCGPNAPQMCTMMYSLGDRCLQYAQCGVQGGTCRQVENTQFTRCKSCVQSCIDSGSNDAMSQFACEEKCG